MKSERIKTLESGIRKLIEPEMKRCGFRYESSTRTFRRQSGECTQIVAFQTGQRTMEGMFTVNLGVFHPVFWELSLQAKPPEFPREYDCLFEFRKRLSMLRDTPIAKIFRRIVRKKDNFLKWWLVTPTDKWWQFTSEELQVASQLNQVQKLLFDRGLPWLDCNSDVQLLKAEHEKIQARKKARPAAS